MDFQRGLEIDSEQKLGMISARNVNRIPNENQRRMRSDSELNLEKDFKHYQETDSE